MSGACESRSGPVLTHGGARQAPRWHAGERLEQLFERRCDLPGGADRLAVDAGGLRLTFGELDAWANRLARHLRALGVEPGDRVGLLFEHAAHAYAGMLAVLKANAAYVPLDVAFPTDRLAHITRDAGVRFALSVSALRDRFDGVPVEVSCVDDAWEGIAALPGGRLTAEEKGRPANELCYVIYTSGSTGAPKGVPIEHAAICNFVRVAVEMYGVGSGDRVYQGMTIAFDFSVEEIWVGLVAGATLVPKPAGAPLLGAELRDFLLDNGVTALCCVPTLLATIDEDLPDLRFLLVSGEACPEHLVTRWYRPGRRFLNVYGPTEATVTATWAVVRPDRPVTIGVPLPTYTVVILDPDEPRALARGEVGEIGIAGIGLARGYLNSPELTERAFVPDFLGIEHNPSGRIYRTGDLGRIDGEGEISYHGRIDTQVKIRGYRVELTEVESVLLRVPGVAQAVVSTHEPRPGAVELVAYYRPHTDHAGVDVEQAYALLREQLPAYMVPRHLERLDRIPMTPGGKADRGSLPAPAAGPRPTRDRDAYDAPETETERVLAEALAETLHMARVSVRDDFFADLGADSLLLARFCAATRGRAGLGPVSMRDVYRNPTVRSLAAALPAACQAPPTAPAVRAHQSTAVPYFLCGLAQITVFLAYVCLAGFALERAVGWVADADGLAEAYLRGVLMATAGFVALSALPVAAKWILVGRWRPGELPVWGPGYLRFWTVKTLIRLNPLSLFTGSPLYVLYLRALGAKVGRGVLVLSHHLPVCTDLLTVGDGAVIRKDSSFTCYRAEAGRLRTGRVTVGRGAFVGERTVLDIDTTVGDGAQLGHSSALHAGQSVPPGESWHGAPAQLSEVDYQALGPGTAGPLRRVVFGAAQLATLLLVSLPVLLITGSVVGRLVYPDGHPDFTNWAFYREQIGFSLMLYFGGLLTMLLVALTVPRLLNLFLEPDRVYPLYGPRYTAQRAISRLTNLKVFTNLFGDSSYIVHYLRALGYDLSTVEQTGSNFGTVVKHENPYLCTVGAGTMVSDGLSMLNTDYSATSFRLRRVSVAPRAFLGNDIAYPPDARVGEDCLLATKVLVPLDGPVRESTGLLGSPSFQIPRSVRRDARFAHLATGDTRRRLLVAKNRHNIGAMVCYLLAHWLHLLGVLLLGVATASQHARFGWLAVTADIVLTLAFSVTFLVLAERAAQGFRPLRPRFCSIYDPVFWRHERFWKLISLQHLAALNGTPVKNVLWRALGVHMGRRVFDDGCVMPEKTLVTVGDDATLNAGSLIQAHSLEDGTFKSDHIVLGAGVTIGAGALVHYGVTMDDGAVLDAGTFLMKGAEVPAGSRWRGNPAIELTGNALESRQS